MAGQYPDTWMVIQYTDEAFIVAGDPDAPATDWERVAYVENGRHMKANAHLISAAPELLEALEEVSICPIGYAVSPECIARIHAALAKAKGQPIKSIDSQEARETRQAAVASYVLEALEMITTQARGGVVVPWYIEFADAAIAKAKDAIDE